MRHRHFWLVVMLFVPALSFAGETASHRITPGRYVMAGDRGTLIVKKNSRAEAEFDQAEARFEIESNGVNCHTCSLAGVVRGNTGYEGYGDSLLQMPDPRCKVSFQQDGGAINVSAITPEACDGFCGARAGFAGIYRTVPAACSGKSQQARRNEFLKAYRSRKFAEAIDKASQLLEKCGEFMYWITIDQLKNDLALSQLHDGKPMACLETLATTRAGASSNEGDLDLPPCDRDNYIAVAKATWHNRSRCEKEKLRAN